MKNIESVKKQYKDSKNLNTRISLHDKYSTNKLGFRNWMFQQYNFFDGCKVLELGCGTGDMWTARTDFLGKSSTIVLSDFSEGMIAEAKKNLSKNANFSFMNIDINNIPFSDNTFDFVIANMMLQHIPSKDTALNEVQRILKPGGIFYCVTYGENGINKYLSTTLSKFEFPKDMNLSFTLQNGREILLHHFFDVVRIDYPDSFAITDVNDLIDYIFSLTIMQNNTSLNREKLIALFEQEKNCDGVIHIPKEYGMFIAHKYQSREIAK